MMFAVIACVVAIASLVSGQADGKTLTVCCSIFFIQFLCYDDLFSCSYTLLVQIIDAFAKIRR